MFDQKQYIKDKIINNLQQSEEYNVSLSDSVSDLLSSVNVGLMPQRAEEFEETVVGWVNFCNIVKELLLNGLELTKENFKQKYTEASTKTEKTVERAPQVVKEELLEEEDTQTKYERLIGIAEEEDLLDDFSLELLTQEGLRATNQIEVDSTSLDGDFVSAETGNTIKVIRLNEGEEIVSPYSGTTDIYRVSDNRWMDIDTEQEFLVFYH